MCYSASQISKITQKVIAKVRHEIEMAAINDDIDSIIEKYGIVLEDFGFLITKNHKVLVLGALSGNVNDFKAAAKKRGIDASNLEFVSDYSKISNFNAERLEYSTQYSDIIYGPSPHKISNMGDSSSLLAEIKNHPEKYPRLIVATANNQLKLTISNFKDALMKTRLVENNI